MLSTIKRSFSHHNVKIQHPLKGFFTQDSYFTRLLLAILWMWVLLTFSDPCHHSGVLWREKKFHPMAAYGSHGLQHTENTIRLHNISCVSCQSLKVPRSCCVSATSQRETESCLCKSCIKRYGTKENKKINKDERSLGRILGDFMCARSRLALPWIFWLKTSLGVRWYCCIYQTVGSDHINSIETCLYSQSGEE